VCASTYKAMDNVLLEASAALPGLLPGGACTARRLRSTYHVLAQHLIPFFVLLDDLNRAPATMPVPFPWGGDFPARYEDLIGRRYEFPDYALIPR
jgi:hypothetical protein